MVPDVFRPSTHHPTEPASRVHLLPCGYSSCLGTHQRRFDIHNCRESFSHGAAGSRLNHRVLHAALCKSSWAEPIPHYGPEQIPPGRPGFAPRPLCRTKLVFFYWEIVIKTSSSLGYASPLPTETALHGPSTRVWPPSGPAISVNNIWNLHVSLALRTKDVNKTPTSTTFFLNWRRKFCSLLLDLAIVRKSIVSDALWGLAETCEIKATRLWSWKEL